MAATLGAKELKVNTEERRLHVHRTDMKICGLTIGSDVTTVTETTTTVTKTFRLS